MNLKANITFDTLFNDKVEIHAREHTENGSSLFFLLLTSKCYIQRWKFDIMFLWWYNIWMCLGTLTKLNIMWRKWVKEKMRAKKRATRWLCNDNARKIYFVKSNPTINKLRIESVQDCLIAIKPTQRKISFLFVCFFSFVFYLNILL